MVRWPSKGLAGLPSQGLRTALGAAGGTEWGTEPPLRRGDGGPRGPQSGPDPPAHPNGNYSLPSSDPTLRAVAPRGASGGHPARASLQLAGRPSAGSPNTSLTLPARHSPTPGPAARADDT